MKYAQIVLASSTVSVRTDPSKWKFNITGDGSLYVYPSSSNGDTFSISADINCLRLSNEITETILDTRLSSGLIDSSFGWKVNLGAYVTAFTGESVDEFLSHSEESPPKKRRAELSYQINVNIVDSCQSIVHRLRRKKLFPIHSATLICGESNSKTMQHSISKEFLALNSDYFLTLFYADFAEKTKKEIELKDVDLKAFGTIVDDLFKRHTMHYEDPVFLLQAMKCSLRFHFTRIYKRIREFLLRSSPSPTRFLAMKKSSSQIVHIIQSFDSAGDDELFRVIVGGLSLDGTTWTEVLKECLGCVSQKGMHLLFQRIGELIGPVEEEMNKCRYVKSNSFKGRKGW